MTSSILRRLCPALFAACRCACRPHAGVPPLPGDSLYRIDAPCPTRTAMPSRWRRGAASRYW